MISFFLIYECPVSCFLQINMVWGHTVFPTCTYIGPCVSSVFSMVVYLYFTLTIYTCQHCAVLVDMLYITINWIVLKMLLSLKLSLSITRFKYDRRSYCHSYMYMALCQFSMIVYLYFTLTIYTCQHCCPYCHAIYNN